MTLATRRSKSKRSKRLASRPTSTKPARKKHLFVLQHGLWGDPVHVSHIKDVIHQKFDKNSRGISIHTHLVQSNRGVKTYSGSRECGRRLYREVKKVIAKVQPTHISFIGYSAGGIYVRYALSLFDEEGLFEKVKPMNLYILCSPNAGTTRFEQQDYDISNFNMYNFATRSIPSLIGGKTAKEFVFQDDPEYPLLHLMSLEPFTCTIRKFKLRKVYGNIFNDRAVGFRTGCLYPYENPYAKFEGVNPFASSSHKLGQYVGCQIQLTQKKNGRETGLLLGPLSLQVVGDGISQNPWSFRAALIKYSTIVFLYTIMFPLLATVIFPVVFLVARVCHYSENGQTARAEERAKDILKHMSGSKLSTAERTLAVIHNLRDKGVFNETIHCWLPGFSTHGTLVCRNYSKPWVPNARDGAGIVNRMVDCMKLR